MRCFILFLTAWVILLFGFMIISCEFLCYIYERFLVIIYTTLPMYFICIDVMGVTSLTDELRALGQSSEKRRKLDISSSFYKPSSQNKSDLRTPDETPLSKVKRYVKKTNFTGFYGCYSISIIRSSWSDFQLLKSCNVNCEVDRNFDT